MHKEIRSRNGNDEGEGAHGCSADYAFPARILLAAPWGEESILLNIQIDTRSTQAWRKKIRAEIYFKNHRSLGCFPCRRIQIYFVESRKEKTRTNEDARETAKLFCGYDDGIDDGMDMRCTKESHERRGLRCPLVFL